MMNDNEGFPASGRRWQAAASVAFLRHLGHAGAVELDAREHAELLREAIARSGRKRKDIAFAVDRTVRTLGYWTSRTKPTMPSIEERDALRAMLGPYDEPGDMVERAIKRSELTVDRQHDVIGYYLKRLREQREQAG